MQPSTGQTYWQRWQPTQWSPSTTSRDVPFVPSRRIAWCAPSLQATRHRLQSMQRASSIWASSRNDWSRWPQSVSVGRARPTSSAGAVEALRAEVGREAVDEVVDHPVAPVHDAGADLDGRRAGEHEFDRVVPVGHAADARDGQSDVGIRRHRRDHVQGDRLHSRAGIAAVAAVAADVRHGGPGVEVDPDQRADGVDEGDPVGPGGPGRAGRRSDVRHVGGELDEDRDRGLLHHPLGDHLDVLGDLADRGAHAAFAHPVRAAEVEFDAVGTGVVDPADHVVPGLGLGLDHQRDDHGLAGVPPLDVGDFGQVGLDRAVADQLDVGQADEPTAADLERAEPGGDIP